MAPSAAVIAKAIGLQLSLHFDPGLELVQISILAVVDVTTHNSLHGLSCESLHQSVELFESILEGRKLFGPCLFLLNHHAHEVNLCVFDRYEVFNSPLDPYHLIHELVSCVPNGVGRLVHLQECCNLLFGPFFIEFGEALSCIESDSPPDVVFKPKFLRISPGSEVPLELDLKVDTCEEKPHLMFMLLKFSRIHLPELGK